MRSEYLPELSVPENVERLAVFRYTVLQAMELACYGLLLIPQTSVKMQLAETVHGLALSADEIGRRLGDLRAPLHSARPPASAYRTWLAGLWELPSSGARLAGLFGVLLPDIERAVHEHLRRSSAGSDAPTIASLIGLRDRLADQLRWYERDCPIAHDAVATADLRAALATGGGLWEAGPDPVYDGASGTAALPRLGPVLVSRPSREDIFTIVPAATVPRYQDQPAEFLHVIMMCIEICAAEVCAHILLEHPDAPWALRLDIARQTADEGRHARQLHLRMVELGGYLGVTPIDQQIWDFFRMGTTLAEQLMIEQRIGEGDALDTIGLLIRNVDSRTARIFDYITADEVIHVANGNRWIRQLLGGDEELVTAMEEAIRTRLAAAGRMRRELPAELYLRRLAGFGDRYLLEKASRTGVVDSMFAHEHDPMHPSPRESAAGQPEGTG